MIKMFWNLKEVQEQEEDMQTQKKQIALIGAGKLGKGYLADLFGRAGYELIFMARNPAQVAQMRAQGYYTVVLEHEDGSGMELYRVEGFQIWCTEGPEREDCLRILSEVPIASIQVYDNGFAAVGKLLGEAIAIEKGETPDYNVDNECLVDIQVQAHIPESYIPNLNQRLDIYRRIADIRGEEDAEHRV